MLVLLLLAAFICLIVYQYWKYHTSYPNPVPWPLPFVGHSLQLRGEKRWENKFVEWKQKYGNVYTFISGIIPITTVNDYDTIIEMFVKDGDAYADRFSLGVIREFTRKGDYGIIDTSGPLWREQRRFALRTLRDFGLAKNPMQDLIMVEVQSMCERINKDIDSGLVEHDFHRHTDLAIGSVINLITNGYSFTNGKEKEFYELKDCINEMLKTFADPAVSLAISFSLLRKIPYFKNRFYKGIDLFNQIFAFIDKNIEVHKKQNDYKTLAEPRDFIDSFMIEKEKCEESGQSHYFSDGQLRNVILDLWFAGQETTTNTITWAIGFLICNQEAQQRLHEEMDRVIGSDRMITTADKHLLHYTQAVVLETQRCASIVSINSLRATTREVTINGHKLPKNSVVIAQIGAVMYDPEYFPEPGKFKPERFINNDGQFENNPRVMPFSVGRRQCPGEGLAKMELFLFIANLLNQYKFTPGKELPTLEKEHNGGSIGTKPYKCKVERRFK